jgi:hypothetical protein
MPKATRTDLQRQISLVRWTARMGAVTAEALAAREGTSVASARARAVAAEREGFLSRLRPLAGQPSLYVITKAGLEVAGLRRLGPCRVSPSNAMHTLVCAGVAAALERGYPDQLLLSERELRCEASGPAAPFACACLPRGPLGSRPVHRPDLALCQPARELGLPVAVEVELTIKAPRRLAEICLAWSRARNVAGVLYLAPPEVRRALERAIDTVDGHSRIVVLSLPDLEALLQPPRPAPARSASMETVPSDA